jgi:hypothetical protein
MRPFEAPVVIPPQPTARKEADVAKREAVIREQQADIVKARESIDEQIAAQLKAEREKISADEAKKARLLIAADLEQKTKEIADLQQVLKARDGKLAIERLEIEKLMPGPLFTNVLVPTRVNLALSRMGGHPNDMSPEGRHG